MKKLLAILCAITLALSGALTLVGCGVSDDQKLEKVFSAYDKLMTYDGDFTLDWACDMCVKYTGEDPENMHNGFLISVDAGNKGIVQNTNGQQVYSSKTFHSDDGYYVVSKSGTEEEWDKYANTNVNDDLSKMTIIESLDEIGEIFMWMPSSGYTLEQLNSAYAKVALDSQQEKVADALEHGETITANCQANVSVKSEGGKNVMVLNFSFVVDGEDDGYTITVTVTAKEKNGFLTDYSFRQQAIEVDKTESKEYETDFSVNVSIDYSFDQQLFDSVSVTQPQEVELNRWGYKDTKNIVINGKHISSNLARGETVSEAMNYLLTTFKNNLNSHSDGEIDLAYYSDKECTTALNFNTMTDEQFLALDTLYVTATLNNEFALEHNRALKNMVTVDKWAEDVSEEYKIVFGNFVSEVEKNSITVIGNTAATQTISQKDREVYFNGVLFTETEYTLTPGQVFTLRIENLQYESDFNLNYFIMKF